MSFLWSGRRRAIFQKINQNINQKIKKKSSPTNRPAATGLAQSVGAKQRLFSLERISLPAFFHKRAEAGMTVEAAVALPLALFFLLYLGCVIELLRLHGNLQMALWREGARLAVYGSMGVEGPATGLFSYLSLEKGIRDFLGEKYLDGSPLTDGAAGLRFGESRWATDKDELDIALTYSVSLWGGLGKVSSFHMGNRYFGHLWSGYEIPPEGETDEEQEIVYVAENGQVYHKDRKCTHLTLSVRAVSRAEAAAQKNQWGSSYSPCEKCRPGEGDQVLYVTREGDRYHADRDCSGLRRTVFSVLKSRAVKRYRVCSRCG